MHRDHQPTLVNSLLLLIIVNVNKLYNSRKNRPNIDPIIIILACSLIITIAQQESNSINC